MRIIKIIFLSMLVNLYAHADLKTSLDKKKIVMITQIIEHSALTAVRNGVVEELKSQGFDPAKNIDLYYENAQGNVATAVQIAQKFIGDHPNVVVALSTPSAQTMMAAAKGAFPIVFSAVTDPVATHLVQSLEKPGVDVTGVIDLAPFKEQLLMIQEIISPKKRIGVLYNPSEANSVTAVAILKKEADKIGMEIVESNATKSSEMSSALNHLMGKVDAVFIPNDNTVASGIENIAKICESYNIPLFAADNLLVEKGVIAVLGYDYPSIGRQTGVIVARILNGENARNIAVQMPIDKKLYVNKTRADKIKLKLPEDILNKADKVF